MIAVDRVIRECDHACMKAQGAPDRKTKGEAMIKIRCNCNWTPGTYSTLGSTDRPLRQEHSDGCDVTIAEEFHCILFSSYTDIELRALATLSRLADRILT